MKKATKPYLYYESYKDVVSYTSTLRDFYGWFDICEHCLVKTMCIRETKIEHSKLRESNWRITIKRPCDEFKELTETGSVGDEKQECYPIR